MRARGFLVGRVLCSKARGRSDDEWVPLCGMVGRTERRQTTRSRAELAEVFPGIYLPNPHPLTTKLVAGSGEE